MTTNLTGLSQSYGSTPTEKTKKPQMESGEKVEGQRPPPPPPAKQDSYVQSEEATAFLASLEEATTETGSGDVADLLEDAAEAETDAPVEGEVDDTESKGMDIETVNKLKADLELQTADFMKKMAGMITGQAGQALTAAADMFAQIAQGNFTVTEAEQAEAQEAISEDGYWGVEQTATRIVDMAKALAGGDPAKAEEMMSYIEKGFEEAEKVWGGELPAITADTKSRIDELFAEWTGAAEA